ncbi:SURF1 family protein [Ectopseudomonas mendocina]|uniref:SURF1-like protein n=1 Tax=Ectopseudomonas mendocina TaxID=300 RepID=A0ABZ2RPL5_ECTME
MNTTSSIDSVRRRTFSPGVLPTVVLLVLLPCLLALGFWQLSRAEEKRQLLAINEARQQAAPVSISELEREPDPSYRRVHLQGFFDARHSLLLDNRTRDGKAGVELLQPFYDQLSGLWVLLNRGWLPWPDRRASPQFTTPDDLMQLQGWVYVPLESDWQLKGTEAGGEWPRLITAVEVQKLWQQLGRGGLNYEVRLQPGPAALRADWPVVAMNPDKHTGYAVQWFAMAAALVGLFIYLGLFNARENRNEPSHHHA